MNCFDRGHIARNCPQDRSNKVEREEETNHARHRDYYDPTESEFEEEGRRFEEYEEGLSSPSSDHGENTGDLTADTLRYNERERQRLARREKRLNRGEETNRISVFTQNYYESPDETEERKEMAEAQYYARFQNQYLEAEQAQYYEDEQPEIVFDLPAEQQQRRGQDPEWGA
jgi:hypothetical protein